MASRTAELVAKLTDQVSGPAKKMAGSMDAVAGSAKKMGAGSPGLDRLTKQLRDAQAQAEKLAQLQNRMQSLSAARSGFNTAKGNVERISRDLDAARKSLAAGEAGAVKAVRELEREQARARVAVRSTAQALEAEATAAKRLRAELASLGVPMKSIATAQRAVAARAQAASAALERQTRAERRTRAADALAARAHGVGAPSRRGVAAGALSQAGTRLGAGLVAGVGAMQAADVYRRAAAFDRRITMIGQTADATRPEIDRLASSVHDLAQETATPVDKLTGGLESLVAQGRSLRDAMDFLPSVARTAAASGSEVDDIAKTADSVGTNFEIAGKQMQSAFDIMVAGGKVGQFELKDMARYLPSLGPAASAIGFKGEKGLSDLVAMLQVMRKGSGTAEEAVSSMNNILAKMESDKTKKGLKELGVDAEKAFAKARKEGRNLVEVFEELVNTALKGDRSKLGEIIDDMEFKRGVQALMSYRGEWQKLSQTLRTTSGGSVARDIVQVTRDAQSAVDRLSNAAQRGGQATARFVDSAFGTSDRLQGFARNIETAAQAVERLNEAYNKGGLAGVGKLIKDLPGDAAREALAGSLPDRKKAQDAQINAMEEDLNATEATMARSGRSQAQIDGVLRSKRAALAAAKRARGDLKMEEAGFRSTPPSMLADPTAPIQGEAGGVGSGGQGKAFQDAFPIDTSGRKPLPARTPLPPQRPGGMVRQSTGDDLKDVLGPEVKPKVDASQVEAVKPKAEEAKTALGELNGTFTPNVPAGSILSALDAARSLNAELAKVEGNAGRARAAVASVGSANVGGGARTGAVKSAMSGAFSDQGMG